MRGKFLFIKKFLGPRLEFHFWLHSTRSSTNSSPVKLMKIILICWSLRKRPYKHTTNEERVVQENLPNLGENCQSLRHGKGRGFPHPPLWPHFSEVTRPQTAAAQGHSSLSPSFHVRGLLPRKNRMSSFSSCPYLPVAETALRWVQPLDESLFFHLAPNYGSVNSGTELLRILGPPCSFLNSWGVGPRLL